jgi:hypothetical protein
MNLIIETYFPGSFNLHSQVVRGIDADAVNRLIADGMSFFPAAMRSEIINWYISDDVPVGSQDIVLA